MGYFCCCFVGFVFFVFQRKKTAKGKKPQDTWGNLERERQGGRGEGGKKGRGN